MSQRRIGAFICECGGNISDHVDVKRVAEVIEGEPDVAVAKVAMFTCSDATQQEIIETIQEEKLDGIVVASCSPKLHLETFRAMASRAGLNRFLYNQVNIREQCSWAHTHQREGATAKAIRLVRAGIARTRAGRSLETIRVQTLPRVMVIGAGVAGLRAALSLDSLGIEVLLVERSERPGGHIASWGPLFPNNRSGEELISELLDQLHRRSGIQLYTGAEVVERAGAVGDFSVTLRLGDGGDVKRFHVGAIVVATGFSPYEPAAQELGWGLPGVLTLEELRRTLDGAEEGRPILLCMSTAWVVGRHLEPRMGTITAPVSAVARRCTPPCWPTSRTPTCVSTTCIETFAPMGSRSCSWRRPWGEAPSL